MKNSILFPFACLWGLIVKIRNQLYNSGIYKSNQFDTPTICVGNITVGGTGKTPHVELLVNYYLSKNKQIATLSRGYKRKTRGYILADNSSTALSIGDEPFQIYKKFSPKIHVAVAEKRIEGMVNLLFEYPTLDMVILDDAFQHRALKCKCSIVLTNYKQPFYEDYFLPLGNLRDERKSAERASVFIVTNCPKTISDAEMNKIKTSILKYGKNDQSVYFSSIKYETPVFISSTTIINQNVVVLTGLANPASFLEYISSSYTVVFHQKEIDHAEYTNKTIENLISTCNNLGTKSIISTEKDSSKITYDHLQLLNEAGISFSYIPISIDFVNQQATNFFKEIDNILK